MKNLFSILITASLFGSYAIAGSIEYTYINGERCIKSIDGKIVTYSYMDGKYMPTALGADKIEYTYSSDGGYYPISLGDKKISYKYVNGERYADSIGDEKIQYTTINGKDYPSAIGKRKINYSYINSDYVPISISN